MATPTNKLELRLDPNGVAAPAQRILTFAAQVVGTLLRALAADDLTTPDLQGGFIGYRFDGLEMTEVERRAAYENWVLSKGLQELARGVRGTLEEALLYVRVAEMKSGPTPLAKVEGDIAAARASAAAMRFPQLLAAVNLGLREPMGFEPEFRSLQRARNCLEHRGGIVGQNDVDDGSNTLSLSFPRLKIFYLRGEVEVELRPGEVIDTHADDNPFGGDKDVQVYLKRTNRTRTHGLGQRVHISASDFYEIALACHMFAADVAAKLPILTPLDAPPGDGS